MKTDNELIAEFHHESSAWTIAYGVRALTKPIGPNIHGGTDGCLIYNFNYDKDWNQLMPVVEKISKHEWASQRSLALQDLPIMGTSISEVYSKVVEAIKWYNQQSK
jgi:hypothetical protein